MDYLFLLDFPPVYTNSLNIEWVKRVIKALNMEQRDLGAYIND